MPADFSLELNGNAWMGWERQTTQDEGRSTYTGVGNLTDGDEIVLFTNFDVANFSIIGFNITRISDEYCDDAGV